MNRRKRIHRNKEPSHKELTGMGYELMHKAIKSKKKQYKGKDCITSTRWGNNGRMYFKVMKMTKVEKKIFGDAERLKKAGKEVYFSYTPMRIMIDFINQYHVDAKKDKLGNIHIDITTDKKK